MAELVEQGTCIVEAQERRLARAAFGEVHHIDDDRANVVGEPFLRAEGAHPSAAALRRAREIIPDEGADILAVRIHHLPGADVGMILWEILQFLEAQAEESMRC